MRRLVRAAALTLPVVLSACGGGGGGGTDAPAPTPATATVATATHLPAASTLANVCTDDGQKQWVRSYLDENYLWYAQVQDVPAGNYGSPTAYFSALLVKSPDASGQATDRFSTSMSVSAADAMQGVSSASADPAAAASNPVPITKTVTTASGRRVGYVLFNQHSQGAQDALIGAFTQLRTAAVKDLVLDLRYNPGGFIYVAQAAASMVAGPSIDGLVFESATYNDKRSGDSAGGTFFFSTKVQRAETKYPVGTALPQLDLPRVYVLASSYTCSASESIVNALRGIGIEVILVGQRTCGKPYGFTRKDNCGQAYFPIEFRMANAQGSSDYTNGFPVQCQVQEDPLSALGSSNEPLLATALKHIETGACPAPSGIQVARQTMETLFDRPGAPSLASPMYQPGFDGRQQP
nr:S41 family peptidase [Ramlibacter algicola]